MLAQLRTMARGFAKVSADVIKRPPTEGEEETACLRSAIREFSEAFPPLVRVTFPWSATGQYALLWDAEINVEKDLWLQQQNSLLKVDRRDWRVEQDAEGDWYLYLDCTYSGGTLILEHFGDHVVTDDASTIPASALEPLAHLAAHYLLLNAANSYSKNSSTTIGADAVSQESPAKSYSFQSKDEYAKWTAWRDSRKSNGSTRLNWDLSRSEHNGLGRFWNRRGRLGL